MGTPGVILTGVLRDITGATNAGTVTFTLTNYGAFQPLISGTAFLAPIEIVAQAASDGTWTITLWGNYQVFPNHTHYDVTFRGATGDYVQKVAYQFNTAGTFDLSTLTPVIVPPTPANPGIYILANPLGTQTITSFPLNLSAGGTSVTEPATDSSTNIATTAFVQNAIAHVSAGVTTWNSRSGNVVPLTGDYSFSQISGSVAASQLPNPTLSTIGGIEAINAVSHKFIDSISTAGVPHLSQPDYGDLTNTPTLAQSMTAVSHQWLKSYDATTGLFTQTQPAFSDISGTASTGQIPDLSATYLTLTAAVGLYLPLAGGTLTGNLLFSLDNTHNIGASGATRPANIYAGTKISAPVMDAATGFTINNGAPTIGHVLRGNGTNFIDGQVQDSDVVMNAGTSGDMNAAGGIHGFVPSPPNDPSLYLDSQGNWTIPSATDSSSEVLNINQVAHGFTVGQWIYWTGTVWALASSAATTTLALGVINRVFDPDNFQVTIGGYCGTGLSGLTAGALYYLNTGGAISTTAGAYTQVVLVALFSGSGIVVPFEGPQAATGSRINVVQKNTNYSPSPWDYVVCDTTSAGFTISLPAASSVPNVQITVTKKSTDTHVVTVSPNGVDTVGFAASQTFNYQNTTIDMVSDGVSNWILV